MKIFSLLGASQQETVKNADGAFDRPFEQLVEQEIGYISPILRAFAESSNLSPSNILGIYAKTVQDGRVLLSHDTIVLRNSQAELLSSAQTEREMKYSPKIKFSEGAHGSFTNHVMGPPLAKHGFGFWRKEIDGQGRVFSTITLPEAIADIFVDHDKDNALLMSMVKAFAAINHDWLHQMTLFAFTARISGVLDRDGVSIPLDVTKKHALGFYKAWEKATGNMAAIMQYIVDPYESWAAKTHGVALHHLRNSDECLITGPINDVYKNLNEVCERIGQAFPAQASTLYNFVFDFLAFNYARAFTNLSPITKFIFEKFVQTTDDYNLVGHTARQVYMSNYRLKIRGGAIDQKSLQLTLQGVSPNDAVEAVIKILSRSNLASDRKSCDRLEKIKKRMEKHPPLPFYEDLGIFMSENSVLKDQLHVKSVWMDIVGRLCSGAPEFGAPEQMFLMLADADGFAKTMQFELKRLLKENISSEEILTAKMLCYCNVYSDMAHTHGLTDEQAAQITASTVSSMQEVHFC